MAQNITPRAQDYSKWYHDVIEAAELASYSPVRGCMVIRPNGYAIWEAIQSYLDKRFKELGHKNAYFPLFIPESFLRKEAQHVEGFAPECAVVTHGGGEKLEEPLVVRPTSETIIGHMYSEWVRSWRDLPILINQWANVVRWELRTRLFLRTSEFLWQEGHTAHETEEEAMEETLRILDLYKEFAQGFLAIPVLAGEKTESERFPGAVHTYSIEGMMTDGKALQMGTSHMLGQNFARAFQIRFEGKDRQLHYAWTTSWGVSTRLIGALVMVHSDDDGLCLPWRVAPVKVAIVPIYKTEEEKTKVTEFSIQILENLCGKSEVERARRLAERTQILECFWDEERRQKVILDLRENMRPGEKFFYWEQRGVPLHLEIGPRDVAQNQVIVKDRLSRKKEAVSCSALSRDEIENRGERLTKALFERALNFRDEHVVRVESYDELKKVLLEKQGFVVCNFKPSREVEAKIKEETKATVRVILGDASDKRCIVTGENGAKEVVFAIAY